MYIHFIQILISILLMMDSNNEQKKCNYLSQTYQEMENCALNHTHCNHIVAVDTGFFSAYNVQMVIAKRWDPNIRLFLYECVVKDGFGKTQWLNRFQINNDILIQRFYEHEWEEDLIFKFKGRKHQRKDLKTVSLSSEQIKRLKAETKWLCMNSKCFRSDRR